MSSKRLKQTTLKQLLKTALVLWAASLVLFFLYVFWQSSQSTHDIEELIDERSEELAEILEEDGADNFLEEFVYDEETEWTEDMLHSAADEDEYVYKLTDASGAFLAGSRHLPQEIGWQKDFEFDEEFEQNLWLHTKVLEGYTLTVGLFKSHESIHFTETAYRTLWIASLYFWLLFLPLAYIHNRFVAKRLGSIIDVVDRVDEDSPHIKIPLSKNKDEFDSLANQINMMLQRLESIRQNIDDLSVGIAHDLKTPLSHLSNQLELVAASINEPAKSQQHLDRGRAEIQDILDTFDALLRLGEIESGKETEHFETINLSELLSDLSESYAPVFTDAGKTLDTSVVANQWITGDVGLINQLISNLLENAIVHSNPGAQAWVRLQANVEGLVLQIGDDGPGIPKDKQDKIYDRFYRLDASRRTPGNGLGLSLVKAICRLHGARIDLVPDQSGTVFDISFKKSR